MLDENIDKTDEMTSDLRIKHQAALEAKTGADAAQTEVGQADAKVKHAEAELEAANVEQGKKAERVELESKNKENELSKKKSTDCQKLADAAAICKAK